MVGIRDDFTRLEIVHAGRASDADPDGLPWQASPSPQVFRKRLELVGGAESGRVTSIVRYEPGSRFPAHEHPDGEEILVLAGTFSDEHGDYPAGTYFLNPHGTRHAPRSSQGCDLFVKLRQYPGLDRPRVLIDTRTARWSPAAHGAVLPLYASAERPEVIELVRLDPGAALPRQPYPGGAELFVLEGELEDEHGRHGPWTWARHPAGSGHAPRTAGGCVFYRKRGHLAGPRAAIPR